MTYKAAQRGFTLIETVVALAILTLALGALYESFGGVLRRSGQTQWQDAAWSLAERKLAEYSLRSPVTPLSEQGDEGPRLRWQVRVADMEVPIPSGATLRALRVEVFINDPQRSARQLGLQTVLVAKAKP